MQLTIPDLFISVILTLFKTFVLLIRPVVRRAACVQKIIRRKEFLSSNSENLYIQMAKKTNPISTRYYAFFYSKKDLAFGY